MPTIVNIRQDPFERTPSIRGEDLNHTGGGYMNEFYAREFWRVVMVQPAVAELARIAIDYPPMQAPASFNLDAVKAQVEEVIKGHVGPIAASGDLGALSSRASAIWFKVA